MLVCTYIHFIPNHDIQSASEMLRSSIISNMVTFQLLSTIEGFPIFRISVRTKYFFWFEKKKNHFILLICIIIYTTHPSFQIRIVFEHFMYRILLHPTHSLVPLIRFWFAWHNVFFYKIWAPKWRGLLRWTKKNNKKNKIEGKQHFYLVTVMSTYEAKHHQNIIKWLRIMWLNFYYITHSSLNVFHSYYFYSTFLIELVDVLWIICNQRNEQRKLYSMKMCMIQSVCQIHRLFKLSLFNAMSRSHIGR